MVTLQATKTGLFGPFWPSYTSQIHARSVARTPFQTVSQGQFPETEFPAVSILGNLYSGALAFSDVF